MEKWREELYVDALCHHGIKGQKWGVRRYQNDDGTLTEVGKRRYADNYSSKQRSYDRSLYGEKAVSRINKRMLNGESIMAARHREVVRKDRIRSTKKIASTTAKAALVVGTPIAIGLYLKKQGLVSVDASSLSGEAVNVGRSLINALLNAR